MGALRKTALIIGIIFILFGSLYFIASLDQENADLRIVIAIFAVFIGALLCYVSYISKTRMQYVQSNKSIVPPKVNFSNLQNNKRKKWWQFKSREDEENARRWWWFTSGPGRPNRP